MSTHMSPHMSKHMSTHMCIHRSLGLLSGGSMRPACFCISQFLSSVSPPMPSRPLLIGRMHARTHARTHACTRAHTCTWARYAPATAGGSIGIAGPAQLARAYHAYAHTRHCGLNTSGMYVILVSLYAECCGHAGWLMGLGGAVAVEVEANDGSDRMGQRLGGWV